MRKSPTPDVSGTDSQDVLYVTASDVVVRVREVNVMRVTTVSAVVALGLATGASAGDTVPSGWLVIAESSTQFTHVQGQNGWSYWFSTGEGSTIQPMQPSVFVNAAGGYQLLVWAPSPTMGCSSSATVCHVLSWRNLSSGVTGNGMHGNASVCCTPWSGRQDPILRWDAPQTIPARIELFGQYAVVGGGDQPVTLAVNGAPALTANEQDFGTIGATVVLDVSSLDSLTLKHERCTPFDFRLRVLTPDCNVNGIADAVEIANGSSPDANANGIPDICEIDPCPGDVTDNGVVDGVDLSLILALWGTSGQKFPRSDANGDGTVDANDLAIVLAGWGNCP